MFGYVKYYILSQIFYKKIGWLWIMQGKINWEYLIILSKVWMISVKKRTFLCSKAFLVLEIKSFLKWIIQTISKFFLFFQLSSLLSSNKLISHIFAISIKKLAIIKTIFLMIFYSYIGTYLKNILRGYNGHV